MRKVQIISEEDLSWAAYEKLGCLVRRQLDLKGLWFTDFHISAFYSILHLSGDSRLIMRNKQADD